MQDFSNAAHSAAEEDRDFVRFSLDLLSGFGQASYQAYLHLQQQMKEHAELLGKYRTESDSRDNIAVLGEWRELIEGYVNREAEFYQKLCMHIEANMRQKLETLLVSYSLEEKQWSETEELGSANEIVPKVQEHLKRDSMRTQQVCDCFHGLLMYIIGTLEGNEKSEQQYLQLVDLTNSPEPVVLSGLTKLKYITLIDCEDEDTDSEGGASSKAHSVVCNRSPVLSEEAVRKAKNTAEGNNMTWLAKKFGVSDPVIESFTCAVSWKILLQGRLYITKGALCFHSLFNNSTLFGASTLIAIPLADVLKVRTAYNAVIFDNSITIRTKGAEFFFTSFVFRDRAYELIRRLWDENRENQEGKDAQLSVRESIVPRLLPHESSPAKSAHGGSSALELDCYTICSKIEELGQTRLRQAESQGLKLCSGQPTLEAEFDVPIQVVLTPYLAPNHRISKKLAEISSNSDVVVEGTCDHPKYYLSYGEAVGVTLRQGAEAAKRRLVETSAGWVIKQSAGKTFVHSLKNPPPIPFFPKSCSGKETDDFYYLSPSWVVIESRVLTQGVPYSDYFVSRQQMQFTQTVSVTGDDVVHKTKLRAYLSIDFVKDTMLKATLEKAGLDEGGSLMKSGIGPALHEFAEQESKTIEKLLARSKIKREGVLSWSPEIGGPVMGWVLERELRKQAGHIRTTNRLIRNQHKLVVLTMILAGLVVLLLLDRLLF